MQDDISRLSERLDVLERQNSHLKRILFVVPTVLISLGIVGARMADTNVFTDGIHIRVEGEDRNRIFLGVNPDTDKAVINIWDKNGKLVRALGEER